MVFYIYKLKKCNYIGSTNNLNKRLRQHKYDCYDKNRCGMKVYKYITENNIKIELEELYYYPNECSNKIQRLVEQFYINKYNSINNGLNTFNAFISRKQRLEENRKYLKLYRMSNKQKIKQYYQTNKNKRKEYLKKNKQKIKQYNKEYYQTNKQYSKEYYQTNKNKRKEYVKKNKQKIKQYKIEYRIKNKEKIKQKNRIKINCHICGSLITKCNIKRHQKSIKCQNFVKLK